MVISRQLFGWAVFFALGTLCTLGHARDSSDDDSTPYLITSGDPQDPKYANAGENLRTGVGSIFIEFENVPVGGFICTASAISDYHILTAAHCVTEDGDTVRRLRLILTAGLPSSLILEAESFAVHPLYPLFVPGFGAFAPGDVAVVKMVDPLPAEIERYQLFTSVADGSEFNRETRHYGHGRSGTGNKGSTGDADFFFARTGLNDYEQTLAPFFGSIFDQLLHDFDSGGSKHNAMAWWFSSRFRASPENPENPDQAQDGQTTTFKDGNHPDFKGYRTLETGVAPGDSGGPGFIDGKIAGVHSFGFTHSCEGVTNGTDFTCGLDSSFGEMSGDARVSSYADWITDTVNGLNPLTPIPEPIPATTSQSSQATALPVVVGPRAQLLLQSSLARTLRLRVGGSE